MKLSLFFTIVFVLLVLLSVLPMIAPLPPYRRRAIHDINRFLAEKVGGNSRSYGNGVIWEKAWGCVYTVIGLRTIRVVVETKDPRLRFGCHVESLRGSYLMSKLSYDPNPAWNIVREIESWLKKKPNLVARDMEIAAAAGLATMVP